MNKTHHTLKTRYNIPYLLVSLSLLLLSSIPSLRGSDEKIVNVPIHYGDIITLAEFYNPQPGVAMDEASRDRRDNIVNKVKETKKYLSIPIRQNTTEILVKDVVAKAWDAFQENLEGQPCTRENINKYVNIGFEIQDEEEIPDNMLFALFSRKIAGGLKKYNYNDTIQTADINNNVLYGVVIEKEDNLSSSSLEYPQEYHLGKVIRQAEGIDNDNDNGDGNSIKNLGYIAAIVIIVSAIAYAFYHLSNKKEEQKEASQN